MLTRAITVVVVVSSVLGMVVGGADAAWAGGGPGEVAERAVPSALAPAGHGTGGPVGPGSAFAGAGPAVAAVGTPVTTLDFERLPDGTRPADGRGLVDEYEPVGIRFVPRETFGEPAGAIVGRCSSDPRRAGSVVCSSGHSGDTVAYSPLRDGDEFNRHPLGVEFEERQPAVSLFVQHYDFHETDGRGSDSIGELVAFDARGFVIDRDRVQFAPADGWQELAVEGGRVGIASVEFWFDRGGATENWFVVDDLQIGLESNTPPDAVLTYDPLDPHPGEWVEFDSVGSSDPDGEIVAYDWVFGRTDGTVLETFENSDNVLPYRFEAPGDYRVSLTVTDDDGATDTATATVVVRDNEPPVARFEFTPIDPRPGDRIVFDAAGSSDADGDVVRYDWRARRTGENPFLLASSSGNATTYEPPTETVSVPGTFEVTLTVTDDDGARSTTTRTVVVRENERPVARFEFAPADPEVGDEVRFDAGASTDDRGIVAFLWDLDGDGVFDADAVEVVHAFETNGSYPVTLLVYDGDEASDERTATVEVRGRNDPPVAAFGVVPTEPAVGEPVGFDGSLSSDADGSIVRYEWTVDGVFVGGGDTPRLSHEFEAPGQYDVALVVTDDRGAVGRWTERVIVEAVVSPVPRIAFDPAVPLVDETVTFDATASTDDGEIVAYQWDLDGDGVFERTGPVAQRRYPAGGTLLIELLVVDDDGGTNGTSATIRVNEPPTAAFRTDPSPARPGETVTFDARASTDDRDIVSYAWDFDGDGRADATGSTVRRPFEAAGERTVRLTVRDDDGVRDSTTRTVFVRSPTESPTPTPAPTATVTPTPAATPTATPEPPVPSLWDWVIDTVREGIPPGLRGEATAAVAAVVVGGLLVVFRDAVLDLLTGLRLPRAGRTTPRRGGRSRPTRDPPDPDETDEREDEEDEENRPPTASVRHVPKKPTVGWPVLFDGRGSVDPDGHVVSHRWSGLGWSGLVSERSGAVVVHVFSSEGKHEVTLTVEDDDGATGEETVTVEVEPRAGELALVDAHPDSPGRDHGSLHLETLTFGNVGGSPIDVEGWTVHDAAEEEGRVREGDHTFAFEDPLELAPDATVTLHTGAEPDDAPAADADGEHHRYWEQARPVWNNEGDLVVVKDDEGNPVFAARYEPAGDGYRIDPVDHERLELLFPDAPARADGGGVDEAGAGDVDDDGDSDGDGDVAGGA